MDAIITGWILCPSWGAVIWNRLRLEAITFTLGLYILAGQFTKQISIWLNKRVRDSLSTHTQNFSQEQCVWILLIYLLTLLLKCSRITGVKLKPGPDCCNHSKAIIAQRFKSGWGGNIFISSVGLSKGSFGVLGEMRWGYERSCRTRQCDSKSEAISVDGLMWNKRKQGDETNTTFCGKAPSPQRATNMGSLHCYK